MVASTNATYKGELTVNHVCQRRGDTKRRTSASTDCPEQISVLVSADSDVGSIGKDDQCSCLRVKLRCEHQKLVINRIREKRIPKSRVTKEICSVYDHRKPREQSTQTNHYPVFLTFCTARLTFMCSFQLSARCLRFGCTSTLYSLSARRSLSRVSSRQQVTYR